MSKELCEKKEKGASVQISVDVTKIVKYLCFAGVLIVSIIFYSKCFRDMIKEGLLKVE